MKFKRRFQLEKGLIDLTPMVNVFFLLFLFFLFTSSFIFQPGIRIDLPKAVTSEAIEEETVVLSITKGDILYLGEHQISRDELALNLRLLAKNKTSLLIKADNRSSLGLIVEIWDLCRRSGISRVNLATAR